MDGIKAFRDDGSWALILPDASEPFFRLYAEAPTQDRANELVHRYALRKYAAAAKAAPIKMAWTSVVEAIRTPPV